MHKGLKKNWLLRAVEAGDGAAITGGSPTPSADQRTGDQKIAGTEENQSNKDTNDDSTDEEASDEEDEDPKARGSKQSVLQDLARERDKRQALEAKLAEYEREKMTEAQKVQDDLNKARERIAAFEKSEAERKLNDLKVKALTAAGLPAEMAGRITGATLEELTADAKSLKEALGPDKSVEDLSQGKGQAGKTNYRNLAEATRAKLGVK
ncbi:hypothetical protein WG936_05450 [Corynebacterium sp. H127]|uniref:hypothetical protein n=1 Tax=Corynebacterium sp. H127 TaxID=3133418 RepID=UPI00309EA3F8